MADWFIATEGVKVVKDSADLWPQIITAVSSAGAALIGVWYGQWLITKREENAAASKLTSERLFIATELIFALEQYAEGCAQVAGDKGEMVSEPNKQPERAPCAGYPALPDFEKVSGDWRSLPAGLIYRIREMPVRRNEAMRAIEDAWANSWPPDHDEYFSARQYEFARMGLKAIHLARLLRKLSELPRSRINESSWSAQPLMLEVLHRERKLRVRQEIESFL